MFKLAEKVDKKDDLSVDVIPVINVTDDKKTMGLALEKLQSILQHGSILKKTECVKKLTSLNFQCDENSSKKYSKALMETKIIETMVGILKVDDCNDLVYKDEESYFLNNEICRCFMNLTNHHANIGKAIAEAGGIAYLTDICRFQPFIDKWNEDRVHRMLINTIAALHNIARMASVPQYFRESKTADAMVPFFKKGHEQLQIYSTLAAAQTCDEAEINKLIDATGVIKSILRYLHEALNSPPSYTYGGAEILELLDGIDKLVVADPNKKKVVDEGGLSIFIRILKLDNLEEHALSARVLWTMSFDDEVAKKVKSTKELMETLTKLSKSPDKAIRNNVLGLLYNLDRIEKNNEKQHAKPKHAKGNHVFISYSWKEKEIVMKIKDLLQKEGVNVWIDTEQMRGSTLQAMAEAVENATLILICMSESYKQSPNCRLESENTFRLGKEYIPLMVQKYYKPDGWLGALLGTKLYIDFSGKYPFEPKWQELIKELHACKVLGDHIVKVERASEVTASPLSSSLKTKLSTPADVRHWLTLNNLVKCCPYFEDVNGKGIMQLKHMRRDAPDFYFKTLSRRLKMNLGDILNLTAALEEL